jgi:hypothetical protein
LERRIGHAVKLLASLPVDDKNNLISEISSIHERWASHPVVQLPYFQTEAFLDIRRRVHKAQMDEALMLDGDPPAQQKHWISHEIGDKVVPKLHACIRATQCLMQGQRLHDQRMSAIDQRMSAMETKLDTIIQLLDNPSQNALAQIEDNFSDDASVFPRDPVTPIESIPASLPKSVVATASSEWFKLSFDPAKNLKGLARKKAPPQKVINRPFSASNITASDYWNEYYHGSPGKPPLKVLEENYGNTWRSDSKFKRPDGTKGTALKSGWSLQKPIYDYLELLMVSYREEEALAMVQDVFDLFRYKHSKKPALAKCKKEFFRRWGALSAAGSPLTDDMVVSPDSSSNRG